MEKNFLINLDSYQIITLAESIKKISSKKPNLYALHCASKSDKKILEKNFPFLKYIYCFEEFYLENYDLIDISEYEEVEKNLGLDFKDFNRGFESYSKYYIRPLLSKKKQIEIIKKRVILNYKFYTKIFNEFKPNIVIHEHSGGTGSKIFWNLCKKVNCDYYFFKGLYFEKKFVFLNHKDFSYPLFNEKSLNKFSHENIENFKKNTMLVKKIAPFEKQAKLFQKTNYTQKIINFIQRSKVYYSSTKEENYFHNRFPPILDNIFYYLYTKIRKPIFKKFIVDKIDLSEKYITVFLQVEPELTTYSLNSEKINIINLVSSLSKVIPSNYKIYIKEHPSQEINSRFRPIIFFRKLKKIPNVKICPLDFNSIELLKNSEFIVTGGGTIVYESILHNIPSIIFGKHFYFNFKSIFKIDDMDNLNEVVNNVNRYREEKFDENYNLTFSMNIKDSMLDGYLFLSKDKKNEIKSNDKIILKSLEKFFKHIS